MQQTSFEDQSNHTAWGLGLEADSVLEPTRDKGLQRLQAFMPNAGRAYQTHRNSDFGAGKHTHVSMLSPYLRHRMIDEAEVLETVLQHHSPNDAFKFIQEVFWRSYWKGWLEHRSLLWPEYQRQLPICLQQVQEGKHSNNSYQRAVAGQTDIPLFNDWCAELEQTGYLHNHARMWFASIWIFTLRLPWELGADYFVRHLIDGDPASNTLGWRWVAGLHTAGKTYLATPKNIRTCAELRLGASTDQQLGLNRLATSTFNLPERLSEQARQKTPIAWPTPAPGVPSCAPGKRGRRALLLTEEDLTWRPAQTPAGCVALSPSPRSVLAPSSTLVGEFVDAALSDALQRQQHGWNDTVPTVAPKALDETALIDWLVEQGMDEVICAYQPIGPARLRIEGLREPLAAKGISLQLQMRDYDRLVWPHASKGFFQLGKRIPEFLDVMSLAHGA